MDRNMNILHSSGSNEWYTPREIIRRVKEVLGRIDLDPASCEEANKIVGARHYFSENALEKKWEDFGYWVDWDTYGSLNIFLNPPGGKTGNYSNTCLFWQKLMSTKFDHAIFLAFSIEALQTTQRGPFYKSIGDFMVCVPAVRIRFNSPTGKSMAPTHSNCIVYVPGKRNEKRKFKKWFSEVGVILNG